MSPTDRPSQYDHKTEDGNLRDARRSAGTPAAADTRHPHPARLPSTNSPVPVTAPGQPPPDPRRPPSRDELAAAYGKTVPDLVAPGLRVLICGINPSLASGATGFHFGRPSNRLWPVLHQAGFTPRQLHPSETGELLARGIGVTNMVHRSTARADEIADDEIRAGVGPLTELVERVRPRWLAFLGLHAYRTGFRRRKATVGRQPETLGPAGVWLLPNPSGLNAHYSLAALVAAYHELYEAAYAD